MSCNPTFPINISSNNSKGRCNNTCKLECNYHNSSCTAVNKDSYISLSYDTIKSPPIKFNDISLDVKEIRIYSPSLHTYNGVYESGELIIIHKNYDTNLVICIPIKKNEDNLNEQLNDIIDKSSKVIANPNEIALLNVVDYNLNNFVPLNAPYFFYTCNVPFDCDAVYNAIVFGNFQHYIPISNEKLEILRQLITEESYNINTNDPVCFINADGIQKNMGNSYIRCYHKDNMPDEMNKAYSSIEGFSNIESIVEESNTISFFTILLTLLGSYGLFLFMSNFNTNKKKK